jgi:hypothetical protein
MLQKLPEFCLYFVLTVNSKISQNSGIRSRGGNKNLAMVMESTLQPVGLQQGNLSLSIFNIAVIRADDLSTSNSLKQTLSHLLLTFEHVDDT